jgi:predicted RNase H-related nuclease YkuK (DUF458 family)
MNATVEEMIVAIRDSSLDTKIYVGCDSKINRRKNRVTYATVVVLHWHGNQGGHILSQVETERVYGDARKPKARLMNELYRAVGLAGQLMDVVGDREFELHLDFNTDPRHKSNVCIKEATGYVLGMGMEPVFKPHAWAATSAGDRLAG